MFVEPYFKWKDKSSKDYFLSIVSTSSSDILNEIGVPYLKEVSMDKSFGKNYFTETEAEAEEIVLELCLEKDNVALTWTPEVFEEIKNWLLSDNFEKFVSYDNLDCFYYFKCIRIVKKFNFQNKGVIEVTFKPLNCYAYKSIEIERLIMGKELIDIYNPSMQKCSPLIYICNYGDDKDYIQINDFGITNIQTDEVVIVDNEMYTIITQDNKNKLMDSNRQWITLNPGRNQLVVEGNFRFKICCEFPVIV